jgi:hypothetical protein
LAIAKSALLGRSGCTLDGASAELVVRPATRSARRSAGRCAVGVVTCRRTAAVPAGRRSPGAQTAEPRLASTTASAFSTLSVPVK